MNENKNATADESAAYGRTQLRRAIIASTVGTTVEWYDFFLYSTVTGLVFAKLYFPKSAPLIGTLEAFSVYFVGFLARPIGAATRVQCGKHSRRFRRPLAAQDIYLVICAGIPVDSP